MIAATPMLNPGDTAWMLTSSLLVLMMTLPGLALFCGGPKGSRWPGRSVTRTWP